MNDLMDFIGFLFVFGMIMSMLGVLAVVGFFWNNKWKILLAVGVAVAGYIFLKKRKENKIKKKDINNTIDVTPKKIIKKLIK